MSNSIVLGGRVSADRLECGSESEAAKVKWTVAIGVCVGLSV